MPLSTEMSRAVLSAAGFVEAESGLGSCSLSLEGYAGRALRISENSDGCSLEAMCLESLAVAVGGRLGLLLFDCFEEVFLVLTDLI